MNRFNNNNNNNCLGRGLFKYLTLFFFLDEKFQKPEHNILKNNYIVIFVLIKYIERIKLKINKNKNGIFLCENDLFKLLFLLYIIYNV